ncbi:hypothetical protein EON63_18880 [archaeon]|nr:MAG: hypothetical protein EON63_18880 [archaeon]
MHIVSYHTHIIHIMSHIYHAQSVWIIIEVCTTPETNHTTYISAHILSSLYAPLIVHDISIHVHT